MPPLPGPYDARMPITNVQGCIHSASWERGIITFRPGSRSALIVIDVRKCAIARAIFLILG